MNRVDLQWLAEERIAEAQTLFAANQWSGAYYLAGYAVECALKACIAKNTKAEEIPERKFAEKFFNHDLVKLLDFAKLDSEMTKDRDVKPNWDVVKDWNQQSRYERKTKTDTENLIDAITAGKHGVLSWLKLRW